MRVVSELPTGYGLLRRPPRLGVFEDPPGFHDMFPLDNRIHNTAHAPGLP